MILYPYKPGSESSKLLADALGIKRISHRNSKFKGSQDKVVINWGASELPEEVAKCNVLNKPEAVAIATDKLKFFHHMNVTGVSIPEFTTDRHLAQIWYNEEIDVVCRTILNGYGGKGIVLADSKQGIVDAPLYTKYIPKKSEYRVHVFDGNVIAVQRKARRRDVPDDQINWKIRNMANGFIFARNEQAEEPQDVLDQAVRCVVECGLTFGAVDVIYNEKHNTAYVLEVNTAPGLAGETLNDYVKEFKKWQ